MDIFSVKTNARKTRAKQKGLYTNRLVETLSRMTVFTDFFTNIFFIYVLHILWDFSFLFFKFKVKPKHSSS